MSKQRFSILVFAFTLLLSAFSAWAADLVRHTVDSDGHAIAVWEKSPAAPQALMLLIHGRTWSTLPDFDLQVAGEDLSLMDGLVALNIATYGVDLRGYGATARDASGWLTPDQAVRDVTTVLQWLRQRHPQLARPHLFGWSNGSMVAQLVVQKHPGLVSSVVLFGYPVRRDVDFGARLPDEPPREPTTAQAAASDFITPGTISDAAIAAFVESALSADPVRVDWRSLEQWRALSAPAVNVPTLLLEAEFDPLALDDVHADFFANLATNDKVWVVIPGGDHAAFMETPRGYFLRSIDSFVFRGAGPPQP
ncbi:MAG: alpha/beta fold hydrolase [Gammaproteobacteria bacterium]|nr:alpha/beta fold hydrolase [Gammaproteobacteria bacterium]